MSKIAKALKALSRHRGRKEDIWQTITFAVVGILIVGLLAGLVPVFFNPPAVDFRDRIEAFYKLALIGVAGVTFSTVIWRGLIAQRQADQQQKQIEFLSRQVMATDQMNLAQLFHKGAEMISANADDSEHAAGIATLQTIAAGSDVAFAVSAMNLIAGYVTRECEQDRWSETVEAAIEGITTIDRDLGRRAKVKLSIKPPIEHVPFLTLPRGAEEVEIKNCIFRKVDLDRETSPIVYRIDSCDFVSCSIDDIERRFIPINCVFHTCRIKLIAMGYFVSNNKFEECDFTKAIIVQSKTFELDFSPDMINNKGSFYREAPMYEDSGGEFISDINWDGVLSCDPDRHLPTAQMLAVAFPQQPRNRPKF